MLARMTGFLGLFLVAAIAATAAPGSAPGRSVTARAPDFSVGAALEPNLGQAASGVEFLARCRGYTAWLTSDGLTLRCPSRTPGCGDVLRLVPANAAALTGGRAIEPMPGAIHYLRGRDRSRWVRNVPRHRAVRYPSVWPGVDLEFRAEGNVLRFDLHIAAGADPANIDFDLEGAKTASIDAEGRLAVTGAFGRGTFSAPRCYQTAPAGRRRVAGRYVLDEDGRIGFALGRYDRSLPLVIDPTFDWCTYIGGDDTDELWGAMALDDDGDVIAGGSARSDDYPTSTGCYDDSRDATDTDHDRTDVVVTKLGSDGTKLIFSTYIGGDSEDTVSFLDVDPDGAVYLAGYSNSTDFPATEGAWSTAFLQGEYILKLKADGSDVAWSTSVDDANFVAIAVDDDGCVHAAYRETGVSKSSLLVRKLKADGSGVIWTAGVSSNTNDDITMRDIRLDEDGNAYVLARTTAKKLDTTEGAFQTDTAAEKSRDAYVLKLDSDGKILVATYYGGTRDDDAGRIGFDNQQNIHIVGITSSSDLPLSADAFQTKILSPNIGAVFFAKLSPDGKKLRYATLLGETQSRPVLGVHWSGTAYVAGFTVSALHPTKDPHESIHEGYSSGFLSRFDPSGKLTYSTYFGTSGEWKYDYVMGIRLRADGSAVIAGYTNGTDLPTTTGVYQTALAGDHDIFLLEFADSLPDEALQIVEEALPEWTRGLAFSETFTATGAGSSLTWSVAEGSLPPGISLTAGGVLSGTPGAAGTYDFTVAATDENGFLDAVTHSWRINNAPAIATLALPDWTVDYAYETEVMTTGGTGDLTFSVSAGALPAGLALSASGTVTGTPTTAGGSTFTLRIEDDLGVAATRKYTVTLRPPPRFVSQSLPAGTELRPYDGQVTAADGTPPLTFAIRPGSTPPTEGGIDPDTGGFLGNLRSARDYEIRVQIIDAVGAVVERRLTVTSNPWPKLIETPLPLGVAGRPYASALVGIYGTPAYRWSLADGELPAGFSLGETDGGLAGTPLAPGASSFEVGLVDASGADTTRDVSLTVVGVADLLKGKAKSDLTLGGAKPEYQALELLAGTAVTVTVKLVGKGSLDVDVRLLDGEEDVVDLTLFTREKTTSFTLKKFPVPATGRYFLVLRPAPGFSGRVKVDVKVKAAKKQANEELIGAGGEIAVPFSAMAGSTLKFTAKAAKGSELLPGVLGLLGPDGKDLLGGATVKEKGRKLTVTLAPLPSDGDYVLRLAGREGTSGGVKWGVKLKLPKGYPLALPDLPTRK